MTRSTSTPPLSARERRKPFWKRIENFLRYVAATMFGFLFLSLVAGIPILLMITSTYGLGSGIRIKAEEMLGGKYYRVNIGKVLFSPERGFILDGLQIHDRTASNRLLVSADRLAVSVNMDSLLRRQPTLERISLSDAALDIPLGPADGPRLRLDHVRGLIICPPEQFRLTSASFEIAGIRVEASGTFLNPKKFAPKSVSPEGPGKTALTIETIQKVLREIRWKGELPLLKLEVGGDLGNSESLRVESAVLRTGPGEWHGIAFREIGVDLRYGDRVLTLEKLFMDDGIGTLQAEGWSDFLRNNAVAQFTGSFNAACLPLLLPKGNPVDWEWRDPLKMSGSFSADWKGGTPIFNGSGMFESGRFSYHGVSVDSLSAGVALRDGKVLIRDFHAGGGPGRVDGDLMIAPGDNRIRLNASLYPSKIAPLTSGKTAEALSSMNFKDSLQVFFEGSAPSPDPLLLQGTGSLELGKAAMRGAWIESLNSKISVADGAATFRDIVVRIDGGTGRGDFVYDYKNWVGLLSSVHSTLDPVKLMTWIDPHIAEGLRPYRFNRSPDVRVSGKVGLRNPEKNDLRIQFNAPEGLGYTLIGKDLPFGTTAGTVLLKGQKLLIDIPSSRLFGGGVSLKADVSVAPGDTRFGASVHLEDVDFQSLTKLYFDYNESSGQLTADYAFRAVGGDDRAMTGKGNLLIKNGNVLAMPILGPLSLLLNEIIPGFGYQSAKKATTDFTVEKGVINTRNLLIQGTGFSMIGNGNIYYLDDRMDMNMRLNAQGLPGLVLFPVSKALEYESVGSAKHPKWRPKILPKGGGGSGGGGRDSSGKPTDQTPASSN